MVLYFGLVLLEVRVEEDVVISIPPFGRLTVLYFGIYWGDYKAIDISTTKAGVANI